jgi:transcriptional regulator with XRE-family HTH domain
MKYKSIAVYNFKENVDLLIKRGYSLEAIAARAEVSAETIRQIKKGLKKTLSYETAAKLQSMVNNVAASNRLRGNK